MRTRFLYKLFQEVAENVPKNWGKFVKNIAKPLGEIAAEGGANVGPALKSVGLWGGAAIATTYGIHKLTGGDKPTQEEAFNAWLEANPAANAEYANYYQELVRPYNEGPKLTVSMMQFDNADIKSVQMNQWREARRQSGSLSYSALYQKHLQWKQQNGME
jgi:hypothetical protein